MAEIIGVIITIATPFAWIAYKHPAGFKRIFWPLTYVASVAMLCTQIWSLAVTEAFGVLAPFIQPDAFKAAETAIAAIRPPWFWILLSYLAFLAYFFVLLRLHEILGTENQQS